MLSHINPRFYVGPNTNELIVPIGRSYGVGADIGNTSVVIGFNKRPISLVPVSVWTSYAVSDGVAKFEIPEDFRTDAVNFPKGFYDGEVKINECIIGDVELVKAPGHYLTIGESVEDKCHGGQTWVEPECVVEPATKTCECSCNGDPVNYCDCIYTVKNNCPTCYNQVLVAKIGLVAEYAGLDEIDVDACPLPDGSDLSDCNPDADECVTVPIKKPLISGIQESKIPEGYIENESDC